MMMTSIGILGVIAPAVYSISNMNGRIFYTKLCCEELNIIQMCSGITHGRVLSGKELNICTCQ